MGMKTIDIENLTAQSSNVYETVVVLSKRARQVAARQKAELDEKLAYYEGFTSEMDNLRMQEEQARVSLEYEKRPKPSEIAIGELEANEIYFRNPDKEDLSGALPG
jgi:DNA-directed RNA polymerase subunit K/omega